MKQLNPLSAIQYLSDEHLMKSLNPFSFEVCQALYLRILSVHAAVPVRDGERQPQALLTDESHSQSVAGVWGGASRKRRR